MLLEPQCIVCIFNQIHKSLKLLNPLISNKDIINTQQKMMGYLANKDIYDIAGPLIAKKAYHLIAEALGEKDPYKQLKQKYNLIALEYYDQIEDIIKKAKNPLYKAFIFAAIGNTIDFGTSHKIDLYNDILNLSAGNLKINDFQKFQESLEKVESVLILGDNAGEIVFDKLLIKTLQQSYPNLEIVYSVRSAPIINDATMEDAEYIKLTDIVKVIKAQDTSGIDLSSASEEFKHYFYKNKNIILSKGQGNIESLYKVPITNTDVFYILKAKCPLMERIFNVKIGDLIFKKKDNSF